MNASTNPGDQIRRLFQKHVPEVASGAVELVSIVRDVGDRVLVAVRSHDPSIHPVSACLGKGGMHPKNIMRELDGEKVGIVLWSESPETLVLHALAPYGPAAAQTPKVTLDVGAHIAHIEVAPETFAYFSEQGASRVRLASRLVGWDIRLISHNHT
jgi:transcription termination/antitermination protein NusA